MTKRNLIIYPALLVAGSALTFTFQNCSPKQVTATKLVIEKPIEIRAENSDKVVESESTSNAKAEPQVKREFGAKEAGEGPLPNLNPVQSSIVNNGGWELISASINGEEIEIPEIDPIAMNIRAVGVNYLAKAKQESKDRVQSLFHVTLHQVCTPIVGNYLGIIEEGVRDLAGNALNLKGLKPETDAGYAAGDDCTADSENESRRKLSREISVLTKSQSDRRIVTFERRGQNLVVIHANTELTFAPLDNQ